MSTPSPAARANEEDDTGLIYVGTVDLQRTESVSEHQSDHLHDAPFDAGRPG